VLVVEAPKISGALITARQAAEQGRDVFVEPGNIDVDTCEGSNALLRDGAILARTGWDVLSEYEAIFPGKVRKVDRPGRQKAYPEEMVSMEAEQEKAPLKVAQKPRLLDKLKAGKNEKEKKVIDNGEKPPYSDVEKSLPQLSDEEKLVVEQLRQGSRLRDDVIADSELPAARVSAVLTMLEIKGVIRRLPGNMLELK
jgi:DNA processing protein